MSLIKEIFLKISVKKTPLLSARKTVFNSNHHVGTPNWSYNSSYVQIFLITIHKSIWDVCKNEPLIQCCEIWINRPDNIIMNILNICQLPFKHLEYYISYVQGRYIHLFVKSSFNVS